MLSADFGFAVGFGATGFTSDVGRAVASDAAGNVYITGEFEGTVDFDPGSGTANLTPAGIDDIFVVKLDSAGNLVWARQMGGTSFESGHGIAVDAAGNVYTTGRFQGTADFDPGTGTFNLTSAGLDDIFVSKLDSSGNFVYARQMGGANFDFGFGITVDGAGNVYTTGIFNATADFDPGTGTVNLASAGSNDIFVSKLDSAGNFVYAQRMGGTGQDDGTGIAVDGSGNVYTTGFFNGTADFDPGSGTTNLTSAGGADTFVSKLDSAGNFVYARQLGGTSQDGGGGITVDGSGNVYTTGNFQGTADFDPGTGTVNLSSAGSSDIFVSKLDSAGNFGYARQMGGTGQDGGGGITVDGSGNVYTTGSFNGTADFDPGTGTVNLTSAGGRDIFVSKLDGAGNFVYARQMGGTSQDGGGGITVDGSGNIYTTGAFRGTADFDPGTGTVNLTSAGFDDIFVSQLTQNQPPVAVDDNYEVNEDGTLVVDAASGVLDNDSDPDMDALTVSQVLSGPNNGSLTLNADGSFTYTPFDDFNGIDTFTYDVSDGKGGLAMATVTINVLSTQQQIDNVLDDVEALVSAGILNNGQGNSLTSKLDNASKKLDQGNANAGINQLEAFINQIEAFINAGILDEDDGEDLIDHIANTIVSAG